MEKEKKFLIDRLSNKTEFIAIDIFRLVFAICVVALHLCPFEDLNQVISYYIRNDLTRLAVPFFFLTSGFFLQKKIYDYDKVRKYVLHLFEMYLLYTILYLPEKIYDYMHGTKSLLYNIFSAIRDFLFVGSYGPLWYFVGLIVATVILYLIVVKIKLSDKWIAAIALLLYAVGTIGNAYIYPLRVNLNISFDKMSQIGIEFFLWVYFKIFDSTRNGLFFGFPYVFFGYLIAKYREKISKKRYFLLFLIFFGLMTGEAYIAHEIFKNQDQDMLFMLMPSSILLFLSICFIHWNDNAGNIQRARNCRKISVLFFGLHVLIDFYIREFLYIGLGIKLHSLLNFFIVIIVNLIVAVAIIRLSNINRFGWLKKFY